MPRAPTISNTQPKGCTVIELTNIVKEYQGTGGAFRAVDDVTLTIQTGEVFGIIGYSGAGKSTLVRCINLLERPTSGTVRVDGRDVTALTGAELRRERQSIGIIFQHFNLFPSRTVAQNVAFPLAKLGLSREEIDARVTELLALVELSDKTAAYPEQLSGGQKQRVAIARTLATRPSVLLCDEATSALDPTTTHSILALLKQLNRDLGLTIVVITHQMNVVKEICDRVAVMEHGRVIESGPVYDVFANPSHELTREFISSTSTLTRVNELVAEGSPVVALRPGEVLVRLNYQRRDVNEPIISSISRSFDIDVNIIFADVEVVADAPIGGTVAILSGARDRVDAALAYLPQKENVRVEVIADAR